MTKLLILFLIGACNGPFKNGQTKKDFRDDLNVEQPQPSSPEEAANEEGTGEGQSQVETENPPNNQAQPGGASGVGNAFWDAEIVKLELSGDYVGIDDKTLYNYDNEGTKLDTVRTFVKDGDETVALSVPPKRFQEIVNIDKELFILIRRLEAPQSHYETTLPPDAFLVRKSDGNVWKISDRVINKDSIDVATNGPITRIFFTSSAYYNCYSGCKWSHRGRRGGQLAFLDVTEGSRNVKKTIIYDKGVIDYGRLGFNNVAINAAFEDLWINGIDQTKPVPQLMTTINKYYHSYGFANGFAFGMTSGYPYELTVFKESLNAPTIIPVPTPYSLGASIFWAKLVGDKIVLANSNHSIVLNRQLEVLDFREIKVNINKATLSKNFRRYAVVSNSSYLCLLQVSSTDEVPRSCAELNTLKIRGTINSYDETKEGGIIVYSEVEGTDDIERVTLTLENEAIKVLARESVSSYAPSRLKLVPISNTYENIFGLL